MNKKIELAFLMKTKRLRLSQILPVRKLTKALKHGVKYQSIQASIRELGLIEPLVVYPEKSNGERGRYILLDGHLRFEILKEFGEEATDCLIATDDEGYTYNDKVNRLLPIQEHFMIIKAIQNGVSEKRIAEILNVDVAKIKEKRNMLKGLCPEAIDILKDRKVTGPTLALLRKVKPMRQIEIAELMVGLNNYSRGYVQSMVAATTEKDLVKPEYAKPPDGLRPEDMERMRREMQSLEKDFKYIEDSYGKNVLDLTLGRGYLKRLLDNGKVVRYLSAHHNDILCEFNKILENSPLEG